MTTLRNMEGSAPSTPCLIFVCNLQCLGSGYLKIQVECKNRVLK